MSEHGTTSNVEIPGWYITFQQKVLAALPRPPQITQESAEGWIRHGRILQEALRKVVTPGFQGQINGPHVYEWFMLEVNNDVDPMSVWDGLFGQNPGPKEDKRYLGPGLIGKCFYQYAALLSLGRVSGEQEACEKALSLGFRLMEGRARDVLHNLGKRCTQTVAFGYDQWETKNGRVILTLQGGWDGNTCRSWRSAYGEFSETTLWAAVSLEQGNH